MRYLMAALAVVTCPCHLPILAVVLAGTALGAGLTEHLGLAVLVSTVAFVASAWSAMRLFSKSDDKRSRGTR